MKHYMHRSPSIVDRNAPTRDVIGFAEGAAGWPDSPTLRFKELLKMLSISKSKAYELMKTDPGFPKGVPLYDSTHSPRFYWSHEAIAWIEGRARKFRAQREGN